MSNESWVILNRIRLDRPWHAVEHHVVLQFCYHRWDSLDRWKNGRNDEKLVKIQLDVKKKKIEQNRQNLPCKSMKNDENSWRMKTKIDGKIKKF